MSPLWCVPSLLCHGIRLVVEVYSPQFVADGEEGYGREERYFSFGHFSVERRFRGPRPSISAIARPLLVNDLHVGRRLEGVLT